MTEPFASAHRKLSRAKKHLAKLKRRTEITIKQQGYEFFSEPHPDKPELVKYKIRFIKPLPDSISEMTGDVIDNLRAVLDHAMYGVAVASGCSKPRSAYFPFAGDSSKIEDTLKGRCKDIPRELWPLLRSYQPYKGGSDRLFALNEVCNTDKHAITIPIGSVNFAAGVSVEGTGYWSMPYPRPVWDGDKNEMELFTLHRGATAKFKGNFDFTIHIVFGKVGMLSGKPAIRNLDAFVDMVEIILREIEAECRRLKIC
jgi:hypothetical protein